MTVRIVRLGPERIEGEGLRIGTVRHPPRGMPRKEFAVGCCCENEARCHHKILGDLLAQRNAMLA